MKMNVETLKKELKRNFRMNNFSYDLGSDEMEKEEYLKLFAEENDLVIEYKAVGIEETFRCNDKSSFVVKITIKNQNTIEVKSNKISETLQMVKANAEKPIAIFDGDRYYDGERYLDDIEKAEIQNNYYVLSQERDKKTDSKEMWQNILKCSDKINEKFEIDAKDSKYDPMQMGKALTRNTVKHILYAEHISNDESPFIGNASKGAFTYAEKGAIFENCTCYDVNSMYSSIMRDYNFRFPIKKGKIFTKKDKIDTENALGIYKLNLGDYDRKQFKPNTTDYYTTYDIILMNKLKIKYDLQEVENNCIEWNEWVRGYYIFGEWMDELYELRKETKESFFKQIMSSTWGSLGKRNKYEISIDALTEWGFEHMIDFDPIKNIAIISSDPEKPYMHFLARLKPFILSFGRTTICKLINKVIKEGYTVYRSHTDSIISNIPQDKMEEICKISNKKIGALKIEKEYKDKHIIQSLNTILPL